MKASKMRDMSKEDLILEESELRKQLLRLRFQVASGQLERNTPGHCSNYNGTEGDGTQELTIYD
jgi:hypothetical protein